MKDNLDSLKWCLLGSSFLMINYIPWKSNIFRVQWYVLRQFVISRGHKKSSVRSNHHSPKKQDYSAGFEQEVNINLIWCAKKFLHTLSSCPNNKCARFSSQNLRWLTFLLNKKCCSIRNYLQNWYRICQFTKRLTNTIGPHQKWTLASIENMPELEVTILIVILTIFDPLGGGGRWKLKLKISWIWRML